MDGSQHNTTQTPQQTYSTNKHNKPNTPNSKFSEIDRHTETNQHTIQTTQQAYTTNKYNPHNQPHPIQTTQQTYSTNQPNTHTPHSKFSEIDRLEEQVAALVQESRGFFETDEELEARAKVRRARKMAWCWTVLWAGWWGVRRKQESKKDSCMAWCLF